MATASQLQSNHGAKAIPKIEALIPARALAELARIAVNGDETLQMAFQPDAGRSSSTCTM
jgi:hypothetical protein